MALTPYLAAQAQTDLLEAVEWYQEQARLGSAFHDEFAALLKVLCETPTLFAEYGDIRRALLRRFPYAVYYEFTSSRLVIHAILHMKRKPTRRY